MPNLTPDPREEKLPVWAREKLASLRQNVRKLEEARDVLKGEHQDSNVRLLEKTGLGHIPLPKNSMIKFANNWGHITVHHEPDGRVRIQGDNTILVRLNAGNSLTVELEN